MQRFNEPFVIEYNVTSRTWKAMESNRFPHVFHL
jgi:hypothetical protein